MKDQPITAVRPATFEALICAALLAGLLVVGLWPFHSPRNRVDWLEPGNGLRVRGHSVIWSARELAGKGSVPPASSTLEIWLQPDNINESGTIFASYANSGRFLLRQYYSDVSLELKNRDGRTALYVPGILRKRQPSLITIAAGPQGTSVYVDGAVVKTSRRFRISGADLMGRLVLGTSPFADDCWSGKFLGLSLDDRKLADSEVLERYRRWDGTLRPGVLADGASRALYLFDEGAGDAVHDHGRAHVDLVIPRRFSLLQPLLMEPLAEAYRPNWGFWQDVLVNIGGFIPFGFCVCSYFSRKGPTGPVVPLTIAIGVAVSLTIEILQVQLPTRSSQTIDVVTNTFGTLLGLLALRYTPAGRLYSRAVEYILSMLAPLRRERGAGAMFAKQDSRPEQA